jgi:hypothetical protein
MTIQELHDLLQNTVQRLDAKNIDDESKRELKILALQVKREIVARSFDPLQELDQVAIPDVSRLAELSAQVEREIQNEQNRQQLVRDIIAIAKKALQLSGVPIPF